MRRAAHGVVPRAEVDQDVSCAGATSSPDSPDRQAWLAGSASSAPDAPHRARRSLVGEARPSAVAHLAPSGRRPRSPARRAARRRRSRRSRGRGREGSRSSARRRRRPAVDPGPRPGRWPASGSPMSIRWPRCCSGPTDGRSARGGSGRGEHRPASICRIRLELRSWMAAMTTPPTADGDGPHGSAITARRTATTTTATAAMRSGRSMAGLEGRDRSSRGLPARRLGVRDRVAARRHRALSRVRPRPRTARRSCPSASMSMFSPPGFDGSPGIVRISPSSGVTKPAPADSRTSRIGTRKPVGRPLRVASWLSEYCVLAMQIGSLPKPSSSYSLSAFAAAGWYRRRRRRRPWSRSSRSSRERGVVRVEQLGSRGRPPRRRPRPPSRAPRRPRRRRAQWFATTAAASAGRRARPPGWPRPRPGCRSGTS